MEANKYLVRIIRVFANRIDVLDTDISEGEKYIDLTLFATLSQSQLVTITKARIGRTNRHIAVFKAVENAQLAVDNPIEIVPDTLVSDNTDG